MGVGQDPLATKSLEHLEGSKEREDGCAGKTRRGWVWGGKYLPPRNYCVPLLGHRARAAHRPVRIDISTRCR